MKAEAVCLKLCTLQSETDWAPGHIPATLPLETSHNEMETSLTMLENKANSHQPHIIILVLTNLAALTFFVNQSAACLIVSFYSVPTFSPM